MQIIEVKNDITKIIYNPAENNLLPYDFIVIEDKDNKNKIISQVINIETYNTSENNNAILKLCLSIDEKDNLSYYNGCVPSKNSKLIFIKTDEIISLLKDDNENINFGCLSNHPNCILKTGLSILNKKLYIQSDRNEKTKLIINKIVSELNKQNKKSLIIDFNGNYNDLEASVIRISDDLKLPLNIDALDTILKYDISDCPVEDKALIQSIILELRDYLKTLDDKFIPFSVFRKVVDDEFLANPVSGLMLLRNKLWYYAQEAIFADLKKQFDIIDNLFDEKNIIVVNVSELSEFWYGFIVKTVTELINKKCYLFFSVDETNIERKLIDKIYNNKNIIPVIASSYKSKYNNVLSSHCSNSLLCKPSVHNSEQVVNSFLLNKINNDEIILYGESTLYIPLILDLNKYSLNDIQLNYNEVQSIKEPIVELNKIDEIPEIKNEENHSDDLLDILDIIPEVKIENDTNDIDDDAVLDSDLDFLDELTNLNVKNINADNTVNQIQETNEQTVKSDNDITLSIAEPEHTAEETISLQENTNSEQVDSLDSVENLKLETVDLEDMGLLDEEETNLTQESTIPEKAENIESEEDIKLETVDLDNMGLLDVSETNLTEEIENSDETDILETNEEENIETVSIDDIGLLENEAETNLTEEIKNSQETDIPEIEEEENSQTVSIDDIGLLDDEAETNLTEDIENSQETDILEANEEEPSQTENLKDTESSETEIQDTSEESDNLETADSAQDEIISLDDVIDGIKEKYDSNDENKKTTANINDTKELVTDKKEEKIPEKPKPESNKRIINRKPEEIPVYETDLSNALSIDSLPFKVGDKVYHPKHGNGIIEGFANYSNKILFCQIEFENVGRRILDPRIAGIVKV